MFEIGFQEDTQKLWYPTSCKLNNSSKKEKLIFIWFI